MGRKPILNDEDESQLVQRIIRYSEMGLPVTPKILRRSVYKLTDEWILNLTRPTKFYLVTDQEEWSINKSTLELTYNRLPFSNDSTSDHQNLIDLNNKIMHLLLHYVKTELLTKEYRRGLFATQLKGLPPNLIGASEIDSKLQYQYPELWYFRKPPARDWIDVNDTN